MGVEEGSTCKLYCAVDGNVIDSVNWEHETRTISVCFATKLTTNNNNNKNLKPGTKNLVGILWSVKCTRLQYGSTT